MMKKKPTKILIENFDFDFFESWKITFANSYVLAEFFS